MEPFLKSNFVSKLPLLLAVSAEHTHGILPTTEIKYYSESSSQLCNRSSHKFVTFIKYSLDFKFLFFNYYKTKKLGCFKLLTSSVRRNYSVALTQKYKSASRLALKCSCFIP